MPPTGSMLGGNGAVNMTLHVNSML